MKPGDHETGDVRDVGHQQRPDLVGDAAEGREVENAWIRAVPRHDHLRPVLARERTQLMSLLQTVKTTLVSADGSDAAVSAVANGRKRAPNGAGRHNGRAAP